ncbi:MAG TPA: hypothetical protein VNP20_19535 [Nocardioidaceae bacterium]|nr:hypothetical protein [Nocardioidaceae bacterium]
MMLRQDLALEALIAVLIALITLSNIGVVISPRRTSLPGHKRQDDEGSDHASSPVQPRLELFAVVERSGPKREGGSEEEHHREQCQQGEFSWLTSKLQRSEQEIPRKRCACSDQQQQRHGQELHARQCTG